MEHSKTHSSNKQIINKVGITENGEINFNLDVFERLYDANIIITKRLSPKLIDKLVENKDKIILHLTCTGYGASVIEPLVPSLDETYNNFNKLIKLGFPLEHVVLRIDPCIPTAKGKETMIKVIEKFKNSGVKRVRFSVLDMYNHVKDRFKENNIKIPYETFHAPIEKRIDIYNTLIDLGKSYGFSVEACGEPGIESIPCISYKDIEILGLNGKITLIGNKQQRKNCKCPSNKTELIRQKPHRCEHHCMYCFWKNE